MPQKAGPRPGSFLAARNKPALAQAFRVMAACLVTYLIVQLLGLKQGYWALFTVLIVMQGSVGATAGAAIDRLIATVAGAVLGGLAVLATPHQPVAIGASLILVSGILTFAAVRLPRLRGAGLTAAIVILTRSPDIPVGAFVIDRILEISLGGLVGVLASRFILPSRSHGAMMKGFAGVLDAIAERLEAQADALESGQALASSDANIAVRQSLVAAEALLIEARRERSLWLADQDVSDAIPRALWRVRNDIVQIGGLLDSPLPPTVSQSVGAAAAEMLRTQASHAQACARAMIDGTSVAQQDDEADAGNAFEAVFNAYQKSDTARAGGFEAVGRIFELAFALRRIRDDMQDLAARIAEAATPER